VFTFVLFAVGTIGIGLLAVPVLAGSGAYALGEALGWTTGLDRKPLDAKGFYATIAVSTLIGIFINFVGLDPIKALFWSAVINGVVAVPLMVIIMLMAIASQCHGPLCAAAGAVGDGVVVHGYDGGRGGDHVRDVVKCQFRSLA
jgi:Mn2+/Fe2+ NRAMP family transporter